MRAFPLIALFLLAAAASLPFTDVPTIDDWAYAYSVERFLDTGRLHVLDFSCRFNLLQVLWGALFTWPVGFSFAALRLSTLVLAVAGLLAFHALVRRRTGEVRLAFWCTALLAFDPLFFRLSLSFMTDVPLVALVAIAFWLFDLGMRQRRMALLAAAILLSAASYLVRELAIVGPPALLLGAAWGLRRRLDTAALAGLSVLAVMGVLAVLWWIGSQESTWGLDTRTEGLRHVLDVPLREYAAAALRMQLTAAFLVAPLALATLRCRRETAALLGTGLAFAAAAVAVGAVPFGRDDVLSPLGLGMSRVLLPGEHEIGGWGAAAQGGALVFASMSFAVLLSELVRLARAGWRRIAAAPDEGVEEIDVAWATFAAGQTAALLILWLWQDRYDLVLVPSALWLLVLRARRVGWYAPVLGVGCALFAVLSVLGTRDDFRLNEAVWQAEVWLGEQGVPARVIDAGYASNGWRLYAYAERFAPGFPPTEVPFLYSKRLLPYSVSTTLPADATVLREWTWPQTWLAEPRVYAVSR